MLAARPPFSRMLARMLVPGSSRPAAAPGYPCLEYLWLLSPSVLMALSSCVSAPPHPLPSAPWSPEKRRLGGGVRA